MSDCLFCSIAKGDIPADIVMETPDAVAFRDIAPEAPTHILVIPREHVESVARAGADRNDAMLGSLMRAATDLAVQEGIESYRIVTNVGEDAGQSVFHLHLHLLGGRAMSWPPG
ncbi:MAG: histidine triad nucleotide-binding protein [Gemmatimonadetes bacterium]|nr:histidine triad nucleotide-binding protein [Gemmatimonadota bacterium]